MNFRVFFVFFVSMGQVPALLAQKNLLECVQSGASIAERQERLTDDDLSEFLNGIERFQKNENLQYEALDALVRGILQPLKIFGTSVEVGEAEDPETQTRDITIRTSRNKIDYDNDQAKLREATASICAAIESNYGIPPDMCVEAELARYTARTTFIRNNLPVAAAIAEIGFGSAAELEKLVLERMGNVAHSNVDFTREHLGEHAILPSNASVRLTDGRRIRLFKRLNRSIYEFSIKDKSTGEERKYLAPVVGRVGFFRRPIVLNPARFVVHSSEELKNNWNKMIVERYGLNPSILSQL